MRKNVFISFCICVAIITAILPVARIYVAASDDRTTTRGAFTPDDPQTQYVDQSTFNQAVAGYNPNITLNQDGSITMQTMNSWSNATTRLYSVGNTLTLTDQKGNVIDPNNNVIFPRDNRYLTERLRHGNQSIETFTYPPEQALNWINSLGPNALTGLLTGQYGARLDSIEVVRDTTSDYSTVFSQSAFCDLGSDGLYHIFKNTLHRDYAGSENGAFMFLFEDQFNAFMNAENWSLRESIMRTHQNKLLLLPLLLTIDPKLLAELGLPPELLIPPPDEDDPPIITPPDNPPDDPPGTWERVGTPVSSGWGVDDNDNNPSFWAVYCSYMSPDTVADFRDAVLDGIIVVKERLDSCCREFFRRVIRRVGKVSSAHFIITRHLLPALAL